MWPKRKIELLATPVSQGLAGFEALLQAVGLDHAVISPDVHIQNSSYSLEKFAEDIFTDLVIWPDVTLREDIIARGEALGQRCMLPDEFLRGLWQTEAIFTIPSPQVLVDGRPILWTILQKAGYSPSLLWEDEKGSWLAERGQGLGWAVSGSWLAQICGEAVGSRPKRGSEPTWIAREDRIDFYLMNGNSTDMRTSRFLGHIPRWKEPPEEEAACQGIAQALELGATWFEIKQALISVWQNIRQEWQLHDFGWVQGPGGTELPSEEFNDMENRRAG